jgi:hypothetical protein
MFSIYYFRVTAGRVKISLAPPDVHATIQSNISVLRLS